MKKAIVLFLVSLLLVLTAVSAPAETTRVEFDGFSVELDPSLLKYKDMPAAGGTFAQYFPGLPFGDTSTNLAFTWRPQILDLSVGIEENAEKAVQAITGGFAAKGNITDSGVLSSESVSLGGKAGLYLCTYVTYDEQVTDTKTVSITVFQFSVFVPTDNGTWSFIFQTTTSSTAAYALSTLQTLAWK